MCGVSRFDTINVSSPVLLELYIKFAGKSLSCSEMRMFLVDDKIGKKIYIVV